MEISATKPTGIVGKMLWAILAIIGAACLAVIALRRGEPVNAIWLVAASIAVFMIGIASTAASSNATCCSMDPTRAPPSVLRNDGLDYVPTDKWVVFGHHFAAIAGAGPLVGPVLAAQMGYLPGTLWILFGVVFAGAVQDFMILGLSVRRDARSLGPHAARGARPAGRRGRHVRPAGANDDRAGGAGLGGGEGAYAQPMGHVLGGLHDSDRAADGRLSALAASRAHSGDLDCSAWCCCCLPLPTVRMSLQRRRLRRFSTSMRNRWRGC